MTLYLGRFYKIGVFSLLLIVACYLVITFISAAFMKMLSFKDVQSPFLNECQMLSHENSSAIWATEIKRLRYFYEINSNRLIPEAITHKLTNPFCQTPLKKREILFNMTKAWLELSSKYQIPWFLGQGTLIGHDRLGDLLAHDHDMDLLVPTQYVEKLREISRPHRSTSASASENVSEYDAADLSVAFQPVEFGRDLAIRISRFDYRCLRVSPWNIYSCRGWATPYSSDVCAFCSPAARLYHTRTHTFIDIFRSDFYQCPPHSRLFRENFAARRPTPPRNHTNTVIISKNTETHNTTVNNIYHHHHYDHYDHKAADFSQTLLNADFNDYQKQDIYPARDLLPLKSCKFMGLELPCPRKSHAILLRLYKDLRPQMFCHEGHWFNKISM